MSDEIRVELIRLVRLNAYFARMPATVQDRLRLFFPRFTIRLRDQVKANILSRFNSAGRLHNAVQSEVSESPGQIEGRVFIDDVPYARIQEYGGQTRPHVILPVHAAALAFMVGPTGFSGSGARTLVFAKRVNHPGSRIPERSYARWALAQLRAPFQDGIREAVAGAVDPAQYGLAAE